MSTVDDAQWGFTVVAGSEAAGAASVVADETNEGMTDRAVVNADVPSEWLE